MRGRGRKFAAERGRHARTSAPPSMAGRRAGGREGGVCDGKRGRGKGPPEGGRERKKSKRGRGGGKGRDGRVTRANNTAWLKEGRKGEGRGGREKGGGGGGLMREEWQPTSSFFLFFFA